MRTSILAIALAATIVACGDDRSDGHPTNLASALVSFRYGLHSGAGFCPQPGMLYRVDVQHQSAGDLTVSGSRLAATDRSQGACLPNVSTGACLTEVSVPARTLSAAEATRILGVFERVTIADPAADCGQMDPCVIESFEWINRRRERSVSTLAFSRDCLPTVARRDARAITDALDALLQ